MSDRILKNKQVSLGLPFMVKALDYSGKESCGEQEKPEDENTEGIKNEETAREKYERIVEDANREAVRIIDEANAIADRLICEAKEKALEEREAAKEEGRNEGYEEGKNNAIKEYESILNEASITRDDAVKEYSNILNSVEEDVVSLVMKITRKVIETEMKTNRKVILNLVSEAIKKTSNRDNLVIKVSRDDFSYVREKEDVIKEMVEGIGALETKEDPSLDAGSCVVETHYGCIDSGIETKMHKLKKVFHDVIKKRDKEVDDEGRMLVGAGGRTE